MIARSWVWASPPIAPTVALASARNNVRDGLAGASQKNIRSRGRSFCQVDSKIHKDHGSEFISIGNQKWSGGMPLLIARAKNLIGWMLWIILIKKILPLQACTKKYLTAASCMDAVLFSIGTKERRFNSIPNQIPSQLGLDKDIVVPRTIVKRNIKMWGERIIISRPLGGSELINR